MELNALGIVNLGDDESPGLSKTIWTWSYARPFVVRPAECVRPAAAAWNYDDRDRGPCLDLASRAVETVFEKSEELQCRYSCEE